MNHVTIVLFALQCAMFCSCKQNEQPDSGSVAQMPYIVDNLDKTSLPATPTEQMSSLDLIEYLKGAEPDHVGWAQSQAMAINILASRKAIMAVPHLIECLDDKRALPGSDNWVGGNAANGLSEITGRPFSLNQVEWREWWIKQATRDHHDQNH